MTTGQIILLTLGVTLYLTPSIVAAARDHHNTIPIQILNVLLGWTLLG